MDIFKYIGMIGVIVILLSFVCMFFICITMNRRKCKEKFITIFLSIFFIGICILGIYVSPELVGFLFEFF